MEDQDKRTHSGRSSMKGPNLQNIPKKKTVLYKGKQVEYVDATPTWEGILPILIETAQLPSSKIELASMARTADKYNKLVVANKQTERDTIDAIGTLLKIIRRPELVLTNDTERKVKELEELVANYKQRLAGEQGEGES